MAFHSPIEQFEIHAISPTLFSLGGQPVAFTNSALAMVMAVVSVFLLLGVAMRREAVIPGRWQVIAETFYNFISSMVSDAAGKKARPFFPLIFTLFMFIAFCNLLGLLPYVFTPTSHIIVNFALAAFVLLVVIVTGFAKHGLHFFKLFVPSGAPLALAPLLALVEMISFFIRPCSLSIRLFGNMLAGHILLKVFAGMGAALAASGALVAIGILPMILNVSIVAFEIFVAFLQAYIFAILSSVYLHDALEMH